MNPKKTKPKRLKDISVDYVENFREIKIFSSVNDHLLNGRKIHLDNTFTSGFKLMDEEVLAIENVIESKFKGEDVPGLIQISNRIHLDFIGWDDPAYNDVLICKGRFRMAKKGSSGMVGAKVGGVVTPSTS